MNEAQVPSRRDFLKSSAGAAAGAAFAGAMLTTPAVYAQADETIKIGLIGCGGPEPAPLDRPSVRPDR